MRSLGIFLVLLLWLLMGWKMCTDYTTCCAQQTAAVVDDTSSGVTSSSTTSLENCDNGPFCFAAGSSTVILGNTFDSYRDSLSAILTNDKGIRITGLYSSAEVDNDASSDLGIMRARSIRALFESLTDDQVQLTNQLVVGRSLSPNEKFRIDLVDINSISSVSDRESSGDDSGDSSTDANESSVSSRAVIYFPFNSTNKLDDDAIESYLDQVAARIINSGEKVRLVGHTDDIGSASSNITLGQRRANIIADYLIGKGVRRAQINASSQGESQPVASNNTDVGRAQNRRTELQIIK